MFGSGCTVQEGCGGSGEDVEEVYQNAARSGGCLAIRNHWTDLFSLEHHRLSEELIDVHEMMRGIDSMQTNKIGYHKKMQSIKWVQWLMLLNIWCFPLMLVGGYFYLIKCLW